MSADGQADCNLAKDGWAASYFWGDNGTNYGASPITVDCHGVPGSGSAGYLSQSIQSSRYFGFHASCNGACAVAGTGNLVFGVDAVTLTVEEDIGPTLTPAEANDLYNQTGWVRGTFPAGFKASDPSGICGMETQVNGAVAYTSSDPSIDTSNWTQCHETVLPGNVDTTSYYPNGSGTLSLYYAARNAANVVTPLTTTVKVDNTPVSLALTGPTEAPSTAGTQYITATASAGPSGSHIFCSVDGAPEAEYPGPSAQLPVSGLGSHRAACYATNNALNASGLPLRSATETFDTFIGQPTASAISFANIIHGLKCKQIKKRVTVPARWVAVHRHGKLVEVHRHAHAKLVKAVKCHVRIVKRRVTVIVKTKRHGRTVLLKRRKVERVVLAPQLVSEPSKRVAFGEHTTVSGFLGTQDGVALPGRTVEVLTAPNNGLGQWTQATAAVTGANGVWTANLPAGPSRLVEAGYGGDSTTLPSTSATAHLIVPAKLSIRISPRSTRWGGTITIAGRVLGGYIPAGRLLRLRIGVAGIRGTVGIPSIRANGRFRTTWTFSAGRGVVHYWFSVSTLNEADYPFAPASSRRLYVKVGPG
ncbi:MAG TPA: hypothetical protein VG294_13095 [Solirubrobacteraceae bacterium]|nr:hypothetical protein [Solirubrobacteraceae bacterium]